MLTSLSACEEPVTPPSPAKLAITIQPPSTTAGVAFAPAVAVVIQDASGNTVTIATNNVTVAIGTNPAGGTLSGTLTIAAVNGVAVFSNLSIERAGAGYTMTASAPDLTGATSGPFSITAAAASKLAYTAQPANTTAGAAISPAVAVTVQDAFGNTSTTATNSVTVAIGTNPGSGTLSGTATVAAVSGAATFAGLSIDKTGADYTLAATASGLTGATSTTFTIAPGPPSKLVFAAQPSNATTGIVISPAVTVRILDALGNAIPSATNSISLAIGVNPGAGTLLGTTTVAATAGVATFSDLTVDQGGTGYTLVATAASLTDATSNPFNVAETPAQIAFTVHPSSGPAGNAMTVAVAVQDAQGNTVTNATNSITFAIGNNPAAGTLSGTLTKSAIRGVATTTLSINRPGTGYTLTAAAGGFSTVASAAFNVNVGPAGRLAFTVSPSSTTTGTVISPAVTLAVQDAVGNLVPSATNDVTVALAANPGGGILSGTTTVAAMNGIATFGTLSINQPGNSYTLMATSTGLTSATSPAFAITSTANFASITAGFYVVCGLTSGAAAYCWGANSDGQTGNGAPGPRQTLPAAVVGGLTFASISPGAFHTCGITPANAAYCWGDNSKGELGNGTFTPSTTPLAVPGGHLFSSIAAGFFHTCAVTTAGVAYCWGQNDRGQLGDGTNDTRKSPVQVLGGLTFASISTNNNNACGMTTAGAAYCWGGAAGEATAPVAIPGSLTFTVVGTGPNENCGLVNGAPYCWTGVATPTAVAGGLTFTVLSVGSPNCGVTAGGAAYCWGENIYGGIGDGTQTPRPNPTAVSGGFTWTTITSQNQRTCGLVTGGAAYCWGYNGEGALGNGSTDGSNVPVPVLSP